VTKRYIYEVEGKMGQPDGPWSFKAAKSRMAAAQAAKDMAEAGAHWIVVHVSVPLPRKLSWDEIDSEDNPAHLGGNYESIVRILNGKWRRKKATLLSVGGSDLDPANIYTMVMTADRADLLDWEVCTNPASNKWDG